MAAQNEQERPSGAPNDAHGQAAHGGKGGHKSHGPHADMHEEHEGVAEWMVSFADNVMLQMGFFVILLAMAMKAASGGGAGSGSGSASGSGSGGGGATLNDDQLDLAIAIREAFHSPVDLGSTDPHDSLLIQRLRTRMRGPSNATRDGLDGSDHDVQSIRRTGAYGAGGSIAFATGDNALDETGQSQVKDLARQFRGFHAILNIRGHCSAAEAFDQDDRGMRLSYDRALTVARQLVAEGLDWKQLRLTACADNERITSTTYQDAGQRSNQRVEVVEINQSPQQN